MKINKNEINFIPLSEASKLTGYTPEYLNSLARKGKLKAKKIGRNWYTQKEWIDGFLSGSSQVETTPVNQEVIKAPLEKRDGVSFFSGKSFNEEKKEKIKEKTPSASESFNWMRIFAALSSAIIIVPLLFAGSFIIRKIIKDYQVSGELAKIYSENETYGNEIINENNNGGIVAAAENNSGTAIVLASENFKASSVTIGGDIMILENGENLPLEIYDIKSESFLTNKNNEVKLVVSWKTNKLAISELDYSKNNGQNPKTIKENSYGFSHSAVITELEPRTSYIYQIRCKDRWANGTDSSFFGIYTAAKPVSVFDLIANAAGEVFGWAIKK